MPLDETGGKQYSWSVRSHPMTDPLDDALELKWARETLQAWPRVSHAREVAQFALDTARQLAEARAEIERLKKRSTKSPWPPEVIAECEAIERKYDIEIASGEFCCSMFEAAEKAEAQLTTREAEITALKAELEEIDKLEPMEINPSNYDHEDVCELNRNAVQAALIARRALSQDGGSRGA